MSAESVSWRTLKFGYADDWTLATQSKTFSHLDSTLSHDIKHLNEYFDYWKLHLNAKKTARRPAFTLTTNRLPENWKWHWRETCLYTTLHQRTSLWLLINRSRTKNIQRMCAIKLSHAATSSANWQELTGVHQLLYFAHLLLLWYIQSQNIVCQCGEDVLMSSTLIPNLTSRCVPFQALWDQLTLTGCLCSATPSPRRFAVTEPPCRSTRRLSSSWIVFPSRRSYVSHPSRVSGLADLFVAEAARLVSLNQTEQQTWEQLWIEGVPPGYDVVTNPMCPQPGFTLPRRQFVSLNRLRCGQARCAESLYHHHHIVSATALIHRTAQPSMDECRCRHDMMMMVERFGTSGLATSLSLSTDGAWLHHLLAPCGESHQTTRHIVEECPLTAFPRGLRRLHEAGPDAVEWLSKLSMKLCVQTNNNNKRWSS